jgi:Xaa-Pro aminopeptidase
VPTLDRWMQLIADQGLDGWLIADFRRNNPIFLRLLDLPDGVISRRAFLWLPAHGEPRVLASATDGHSFSTLPYPVTLYGGFEGMCVELQKLVPGSGRIAMEYVERGALPTVSRVDAGLVELIRSFGVEVVSSALLIAGLEIWDNEQRTLHERAARVVDEARRQALERCADALRRDEVLTEGELSRFIVRVFAEHGLETGHLPDVAINAHAADPHYSPGDGEEARITRDAVLLIDLFARVSDAANAPYADSTWMSYTGSAPPDELVRVFDAVRAARDAAIEGIRAAVRGKRTITGREVDTLARDSVAALGLDRYLIHRTGHSLGIDHVHGLGTNLDGIEFPDDRPLLAGSGFTIEPGLYFPGRFGVRLEVSAVLTADDLVITTETQRELTLLFAQ